MVLEYLMSHFCIYPNSEVLQQLLITQPAAADFLFPEVSSQLIALMSMENLELLFFNKYLQHSGQEAGITAR